MGGEDRKTVKKSLIVAATCAKPPRLIIVICVFLLAVLNLNRLASSSQPRAVYYTLITAVSSELFNFPYSG